MESIPVELYGFGECDACQRYGIVFITGEAGCVFICGDCLLTAKRGMELIQLGNPLDDHPFDPEAMEGAAHE